MVARKTDYFSSFLDAMNDGSAKGAADPSNKILKALASGEKSPKDLVDLADNSLSTLFDVIQRLQDFKMVEQTDSGNLRLTPQGRDYVQSVP